MSLPLPLRPHLEAELDLLDAALYYAGRSPSASEGFLAAIEEALAQLAAVPRVAPAWPGLPDVRRLVLTTYPYAIVYAITPEEILVLAFEHLKRRPGRWLARLR